MTEHSGDTSPVTEREAMTHNDGVERGAIMLSHVQPRIEVVDAPQYALISLAAVALAESPGCVVRGDRIDLGYPESVTYKVTGWDPVMRALEVERDV